MTEDTSKLNNSKLGTKEYWDEFYAIEQNNFDHNPQDTGECWFSDCDAEEKMITFLFDNVGEKAIKEDCTMVDIGTGNGHLLFSLRDEGFKGLMKGIDYSENSINFAKSICEEQEYSDFEFETVDIFNKEWNPSTADVILDKGTLDAIALCEDKSLIESYSNVIQKLLHKDSILLITSCNFTENELIQLLTKDGNLKIFKKIIYPSFEFGGIKGQTICSIAFCLV